MAQHGTDAQPASAPPTTDTEITALAVIVDALSTFPHATRARILNYLNDRYSSSPAPATPSTEQLTAHLN